MVGAGPFRQASHPRRTRTALVLLSLAVLVIAGCSNRRPTADFSFEPEAPCVNELVYFEDSSTDPDSLIDLIAWEWTFGDGGTATGREAWHQFRSANDGSPWRVTLKVTDAAQNQAVKLRLVSVRAGEQHESCGYTIQKAGTSCERMGSACPAIPAQSQLPLHREDVWTSWWEAPPSGALYLLVEVYFPQFPKADSPRWMDCRWTIYSRGTRNELRPEFIREFRTDTRLAGSSDAYAVGFPLELAIERDLATPGWYQVFADIQGVGDRRTVVDFLIHADGVPPAD